MHEWYMICVFCKLQVCGENCDILTQTLTDNPDEQNSAVLGQLRTLRGQLLLLDDHCTTDSNTEDNTTTSPSILCETIQSKLHQLVKNISDHVRNGS